jgi:tetratricopeptide (TPR) repeat protein
MSVWSRRRDPLLILLAGLAAYATSFLGAFVLDDRPAILDNLRLRHLWPPDWLLGTMRPLVELSLTLNYAMGRLNPWGYHAVNLAIHLAAALVLYGLVRRTLEAAAGPAAAPPHASSPRRTIAVVGSGRMGALAPRHPLPHSVAFAVSLLWVVHPLTTQAVTYVIQRAESLMGLCYLLTLYCTLRGATADRPRRWYGLAVLCCALGMASKPVMVTAPLLALLYDRTFLSGSVREALRVRRGLYLGLAATWGVLVLLKLIVPPEAEATAGFQHKLIRPMEYAATQPAVILHYLRLAFWPHPLVIDYDWPIARTAGAVLPAALILVALLALTVWALRRRRTLGFLGVWVFGILAPTSSMFPLSDLAFEHRMYLPLAGAMCLIVLGVHRFLDRRLAAALLVFAAAGLGTLTARRSLDYRSELAIWADTVRKRPTNARAHLNLGFALANQGQVQGAYEHSLEGVRLRPGEGAGHLNLGYTLAQFGDYDQAIRHFEEVLRLRPNDPDAYNNLGLTMARLGRLDGAIAYYQQAIQLKPDDPRPHSNLGMAYARLGRRDEAIGAYRRAIELGPQLVNARVNLGHVLLNMGRHGEAAEEYGTAARLDPGRAEAHQYLGVALTRLGRVEEAARAYRQALRLAPDYAEAHGNLGAVLMHLGDSREAARHLARALELKPDLVEARENLDRLLLQHPELRSR